MPTAMFRSCSAPKKSSAPKACSKTAAVVFDFLDPANMLNVVIENTTTTPTKRIVNMFPVREFKDAIPFLNCIWNVSGKLSTSSSFDITFDPRVFLDCFLRGMVIVNKITLSSLFIDL